MANAAAGIHSTLTFNMQTKSNVIKKDSNGKNKIIGDVVQGSLIWGIDLYKVRSGPWGDGALPMGVYTVDWVHLVEGSPASSSSDFGDGFKFTESTTLRTSVKVAFNGTEERRPLTGFFIPIVCDTSSSRTDLGIHPDGNVYGTQGCIGIIDDDAVKFWRKVLATSPSGRPRKLSVNGTPELTSAPVTINTDGTSE